MTGRVSDDRLRAFAEYPANWMRADYFESVAAELLDARARITRAAKELSEPFIKTRDGYFPALAQARHMVIHARAILTGDADGP